MWISGLAWVVIPNLSTSLPLLVAPAVFYNWKYSLILAWFSRPHLSFFHSFILLIGSLNLTLFDLITYKWLVMNEVEYFPLLKSITCLGNITYSPSSPSLDISELWYVSHSPLSPVWTTTSTTNTTLLNFFTLVLENSLSTNLYALCTTYTTVYFYVELPQLTQLTLLFFVLLMTSTQHFLLQKSHERI